MLRQPENTKYLDVFFRVLFRDSFSLSSAPVLLLFVASEIRWFLSRTSFIALLHGIVANADLSLYRDMEGEGHVVRNCSVNKRLKFAFMDRLIILCVQFGKQNDDKECSWSCCML